MSPQNKNSMSKILEKLVKISKIVTPILIICSFVFSPLFMSPKKVEAQYAVTVVGDVVQYIGNALQQAGNAILGTISGISAAMGASVAMLVKKDYILDGITQSLVRAMLRGIIQSTLAWVRGGFQGNPAFVQDPSSFFTRIADNEIGRFIYGSELKWMCSPFRLQIQRAIIRNYSFQDTNQCSLTQVLDNFKGFTDSVNNELGSLGGWDMWSNVSGSPSNNPYGAYALAGIQLEASISGEFDQKKAQLGWNGGFLSWQDPSCISERTENKRQQESLDLDGGITGESSQTVYEDASGNVSISDRVQGNTNPNTCPIITPGSVIKDQVNKTLGAEIDQLISADEITEALTGMVLSLVQQSLGGNGGLAGASYYSGADYSQQFAAQERDIFVQGKSDLIDQIIGRVDVENQFISIKNQTIYTVDISAEKIKSVMSCYQSKIATSSPISLNQNDRDFALNEIRSASTTYSLILSYQNGMKRDITIANLNIDNLNKLSDATTNLPFEKREQLTFLTQQFNGLFSKIHNEGDLANAQLERDFTIPDRLKTLDEASDKKYQECQNFPSNNNSVSSGGGD